MSLRLGVHPPGTLTHADLLTLTSTCVLTSPGWAQIPTKPYTRVTDHMWEWTGGLGERPRGVGPGLTTSWLPAVLGAEPTDLCKGEHQVEND